MEERSPEAGAELRRTRVWLLLMIVLVLGLYFGIVNPLTLPGATPGGP
ncbi:MAG: hypothetical protein R3B09_15585 [Nannocystaceae bacterium]